MLEPMYTEAAYMQIEVDENLRWAEARRLSLRAQRGDGSERWHRLAHLMWCILVAAGRVRRWLPRAGSWVPGTRG